MQAIIFYLGDDIHSLCHMTVFISKISSSLSMFVLWKQGRKEQMNEPSNQPTNRRTNEQPNNKKKKKKKKRTYDSINK